MSFTRRFTSMPDLQTIREIEGPIIVDEAPEGAIQGADWGIVALACETEDGGFMTDPVQPADVYHPKGGPILVGRDQWAALVGTLGFTFNGLKNQFPCCRRSNGEFWNGNGYIQTKSLLFRRLYIVRVDTSIGSLVFSPLAFLESATAGPWTLAAGQTLVCSRDGGADTTATFNATAASVTGSAATFGTIGAGEYVDLAIDGAAAVRTTFQTGDTTVGAVYARINAAFGSPIGSASGGQLKLDSATLGTSSKVQVVGGSTGTLTKLGLTAGTTSGTGNVANIAAVKFSEVKAIVEAAVTGSAVRQTATGKLRLCSTTGTTGSIRVQSGSTATAFGFTTATTVTASSGAAATTIPAGTVCNDGGDTATRVLTMQTLQIPANTTAPVTVKCRPAQDDGTYAGVAGAAIDTIETVISPNAEWTVTNPQALSAALTEAQKDAAYEAAIKLTKAISGPTRTFDFILSARHSNRINTVLIENAKQASARGCKGRKVRLGPPLGTSLATMTGASEPAVTQYRHERVQYVPGCRRYVSEIAALGAALGGIGFTDTGEIEVHGDLLKTSLDSMLNPEENACQTTDFVPEDFRGVESALANWTIDDYIAAKAAGICAPIWNETAGTLEFQSGVTTVDKNSYPSQVPEQRIKLADWLTDSVAEFEKPHTKKLRTPTRATMLLTKLEEFLGDLKDAERIATYTAEEGPRIRRAHVLDWRVEPLDSMDSIVNRTTIGEGAIESTTARVGA